MRRTPAFLVLLALVSFWAGCSSDKNNTANSNAPGTTGYGNSTASPSTTTVGSEGGGKTPAAANTNRPGDPGIKPPTDK